MSERLIYAAQSKDDIFNDEWKCRIDPRDGLYHTRAVAASTERLGQSIQGAGSAPGEHQQAGIGNWRNLLNCEAKRMSKDFPTPNSTVNISRVFAGMKGHLWKRAPQLCGVTPKGFGGLPSSPCPAAAVRVCRVAVAKAQLSWRKVPLGQSTAEGKSDLKLAKIEHQPHIISLKTRFIEVLSVEITVVWYIQRMGSITDSYPTTFFIRKNIGWESLTS